MPSKVYLEKESQKENSLWCVSRSNPKTFSFPVFVSFIYFSVSFTYFSHLLFHSYIVSIFCPNLHSYILSQSLTVSNWINSDEQIGSIYVLPPIPGSICVLPPKPTFQPYVNGPAQHLHVEINYSDTWLMDIFIQR